jgi:Fic family protein
MEWKENIKSVFTYDIDFNRISAKKVKLDSLRPIPKIALERIRESFFVEWTYNSNSIEGNTLTLQETKMVLLDGMTVKGKSLREHFETVNHKEAIDFVATLANPKYILKEKDILDIHQVVLHNIEREFGGRYRNSGVRIVGANFIPPNALKISDLMADLIDYINANINKLHPVQIATIFHHRFVWIHPFFDGNGRTVRLLFNLLLMKFGYPPAIILKNDRKKYYDALNKANQGDYAKLALLVAQATERSLDIYLSNFDNYADEFGSISSIVSEDTVPYGQEYISLLARQGKIAAHKEGRNWVTTKDAIDSYISTRKRVRKIK